MTGIYTSFIIRNYRLRLIYNTSEAAGAVEAVSAELALGQTDGVDEVFERVKLERSEAQALAYYLHHALIFGRACGGIFLKILVLVALKLFYYAARYQFEVALRRREADERTAVDERRTGYAHVSLAHAVVEQHLNVVAQLCAAHDRVVAEQQTLVLEHGAVGISFIFATRLRSS